MGFSFWLFEGTLLVMPFLMLILSNYLTIGALKVIFKIGAQYF
jgi:hypothetical protein